MKKLIVGICAIVVFFLLFVYIFIPGHIQVRKSAIVKVSPQAAARILSVSESWQKWWPGNADEFKHAFPLRYKASQYKINQRLSNTFNIDIVDGKDSLHSLLTLLPLRIDSLEIEWNAVTAATLNPFARIRKYLHAKQTKNDMGELVIVLKNFLQQQKNVYGINITREVVKDTLVALKVTTVPSNPSTVVIYDAVRELATYIHQHNAKETNPPMVNIERQADSLYRLMVAIPIDHEIPSSDKIEFRRLVEGYILVADVQGGPGKITSAFNEMYNFISDYSRSPVAIPFESLVTNRLAEQDTLKWHTRIYFPVIL